MECFGFDHSKFGGTINLNQKFEIYWKFGIQENQDWCGKNGKLLTIWFKRIEIDANVRLRLKIWCDRKKWIRNFEKCGEVKLNGVVCDDQFGAKQLDNVSIEWVTDRQLVAVD